MKSLLNDLERATDIAMSMVREYGMSEKLGPMTFQNGKKPQFFDFGFRTGRELSEEVSKEIDSEVKKIIFDTHIRSEERRVGKEGRSRWSPYH